MIRTSAKKNAGIEEFEQLLEQMFFHGEIRSEDEVVITSMRHKEALCEAYDSLKMVQKSLEDDMPEDFYSIDLMSAYASLGRIIGEGGGRALLTEIVAGNAGFVYDWCRKHAMIHDNGMFVWCAFYCRKAQKIRRKRWLR